MSLLPVLPAHAARMRVPVLIDYPLLDAALKARLYTGPGGSAALWTGSDQCQYFYATNPRFERGTKGVRLETNGDLNLGMALGGQCLNAVEWSGIVQIDAAPYIDHLALKLRVTNANLYDPSHQKAALVERGFDLVKGSFIPQLETFTYDVKPRIARLKQVVVASAPSDQAARIDQVLASLTADSAVIAEDRGVLVTFEAVVPDDMAPAVSQALASLSAERGEVELAAPAALQH
ncbi:MAG: hypothetical protein ACREQN_16380 [Candidatus Binataceae bacterium]